MIWISLEKRHYSIIQDFDHIALIKMKVLLANGKEKIGIGMAPKVSVRLSKCNFNTVLFFSYRKADLDG